MSAIVILSGGMDSTAAAYLAHVQAVDDDGVVEYLSFDYGQRHVKELDYAAKTAAKLEGEHIVVDLSKVQDLIATSALTNDDIDVPEGHYEEESMKQTVVPNRNAIMLNIAVGRAVSIGAYAVFAGVHAGDHAVYPDCRPEFIDSITQLARVANEGFIDPNFVIRAPWLHLTKADIVRAGEDLDVPWKDTWTCYKGGQIHCGRCSTCVERLEAFHEADVKDPVSYADTSYWKEIIDVGT
jgi:7-cyano-7-deazaguanine synthase